MKPLSENIQPELTQEIKELIQIYLKKGYTSVSYAVVLDGELVANDALGTKGGPAYAQAENAASDASAKATTDCTYNVASLSKIYTTAAVMKLVEEGKLDLDTPVVRYLPQFRTLNAGYEQMTLRHCLSHQCALPGTQWIDFSVSDQSEVDYYADALDFYANSHLKALPGTYSVYCNDGFTIAEMCVAAVCEEKSFSEYCRIHITDPIAAWSSRFARSYNPDYPMIAQGKGPAELVTAQGLGGLTTSMKHLAAFGCQFLPDYGGQEVHLLRPESLREITSPQGRTFLRKDTTTSNYGLGWDNVHYQHPDYDLGENALRKGGASFQFGSNLMVIPKYNAVVCMSQTYDCDLNTRDLSLQILALCILKLKGINITRFKPVSDSFAARWAGDYLDNNHLYHVRFHGTRMYLYSESSGEKKDMLYGVLGNTGSRFESEDQHRACFEQVGRRKYLLVEYQKVTTPFAEKIRPARPLTRSWEKRLGKTYLNVRMTWYDEILCDMMAGFTVQAIKDHPGYLFATFAAGESASDMTDSPVLPLDANTATGFINTPSNASRDLVSLLFFKEDRAEYCTTASYIFRDASTLPLYRDDLSCAAIVSEAALHGHSAAFRIDAASSPLKSLRSLAEQYRCLLVDETLCVVTDTLMKTADPQTGEPEGFREIKKGFLLLAKKPH